MPLYIYIYIYILGRLIGIARWEGITFHIIGYTCAFSVTVIAVGNGISDPSSNQRWGGQSISFSDWYR